MRVNTATWSPTTIDEGGHIIPTPYFVDDIVTFENVDYKCIKTHAASPFFRTDFLLGCWSKYLGKLRTRWSQKTLMDIGDRLYYEHISLVCNIAHESSQSIKSDLFPSLNTLNPSRLVNSDIYSYFLPWSGLRNFPKDQILYEGGRIYRCIKAHAVVQSSETDVESEFYDPYGMAVVYKTRPGSGTDWKTYWELLPMSDNDVNVNRWALGRKWVENDICENNHQLYRCISSYTGTSKSAIDNYEPGVGKNFEEYWEKFYLWSLEPLRQSLAVNWFSDIPFIADYIEAIDEEFLPLIDYPMTALKNIRNISTETELDVLKLTTEMHGFRLEGFNQNLVNAKSFYRYVTYLCQYRGESGTKYFIDFINFLVKPPTVLDTDVPIQYTISDPSLAKWIMEPLYTSDYNTFWTKQEIIIKHNRSSKYTFKGNWQDNVNYNEYECVYYNGWYWSSVARINLNEKPSALNSKWVLVSVLDDVDYESLPSEPQTNNFKDSNLLYLNKPTGTGYYRTNKVYLYRTDRKERIGTNLESYPEYLGITKVFYEFAPANYSIYEKNLGKDVTLNLIRVYELGPEMCEIEECELIPLYCSADLITYPKPVTIGNWVAADLGTCITCAQVLFVPVVPD